MRVRPLLLRVHRWLALLAAIPLALAAATGALLVFEGEIDRALNRDYWSVQSQSQRLPWQAVVAAAERAKPHDVASGLHLPAAADVAAEVILKSGLQVSVDPYSGRVLGARRREQILMAAVHQFHTRLLLGEWGSRIMGVSALTLVILSLTGLLLWWPHKRFRVRWTGSWRSRGRDLLPIREPPGTVPFCGVRGTKGDCPPLRGRFSDRQLHYGLGIVGLLAWLLLGLSGAAIAFESLVRPALYYLTGSKPNEQPTVQSLRSAGAGRLTVDEALAAAERALPNAETTVISLPTTPAGTFMAYMKFPEDHTPAGRSRVIVDQYSGRALWVENSRTTALGTRLWIKNRPLHTGDIFGWPTRVLASAACLALLVQLATGIVMWRPRAKKKQSVTASDPITRASTPQNNRG